ncbi:hypothetical protein DRW41_10505 [Neobacillus piezotolerans]|uniref:SCP domain-containing protein n=1 Tax=Neobacillus piezotolerans TaxID=2259171 RepID=A0A3D8GRL3_9BACI|nr:CAP domain-containing protein [Neobacillus piezotolerans]RDU37105.1 hypothetical protein DRW41_10505 [Neobacillus piezotolerans]
MKLKKCVAIALALTTALGVSNFTPAISQPNKVEAAENAFTKDQIDSLNYLNSIRRAMGIPEVKLNPLLNKASANHANYLKLNHESGHREEAGKPGYTGSGLLERMLAAGMTDNVSLGEVIAYSPRGVKVNIDQLVNTAYHRSIILSPDIKEIGLSYNGSSYVLNTAGYTFEDDYYASEASVYPYDGQKDVEIGFYGFENPNPIAPFGVAKTGYIISYYTPGKQWAEGMTLTLKDPKGTILPVFQETNAVGDSYFFPKQELKYNTTYTATVSYFDGNAEENRSKTWSFTTKADPYPASPPPAKTTPKAPICPKPPVKVMWKGLELKKGQLGLATIKSDTTLYKLKDNKLIFSRILKKGDVYRIYAFKGTKLLGLGGGYYVDRDSRVTYETPSKEKIALANCNK